MRSSTFPRRSALAARVLATSLLLLPALAVAQPRKPVVPKPAPQQPTTPPPALAAPVTSAVGKPIGAAVSKLIGAEGGSVSAGDVTITVPAGAVTGATVQLQPVSDELNGSGQGMAISVDAPLQKPLLVTFHFPPGEANSSTSSLAVQQGDGSWTSFAPVQLNEVAGTVTGALSPEMVVESKKGAPAASKGVHIVKYLMGWIDPDVVQVQPGEQVEFRPRARVFVDPPPGCPAVTPILAGYDMTQLLDTPRLPKCLTKVMKEYNIPNRDPDYERVWFINRYSKGRAEDGSIDDSPRYGVKYTAPKEIPYDRLVHLNFLSSWSPRGCKASTGGPCTHEGRSVFLGPARVVLLGPVKYVATELEPFVDEGQPGGVRTESAMNKLWFDCGRSVRVCAAKGQFTWTITPREPDVSGCRTTVENGVVQVEVGGDNEASTGTLSIEALDPAQQSDSTKFRFAVVVMATGGLVKETYSCPGRKPQVDEVGHPVGTYVLYTPGLLDNAPSLTSRNAFVLSGTWSVGDKTYKFVLTREAPRTKFPEPK